jgi:hypothetical protein
MRLDERHVELVRQEVERSHITSPLLKDDLIDHLCCSIEEELARGNEFSKSLQGAIDDLAPRGLYKIQIQTNVLLDSKYTNMKKLTFLFGLLSTMTMSLGWTLRILRYGELANAIFAFGMLAFVALFLPLLAILYFRGNTQRPWYSKWQMMLGSLSFIFIGFAWLLKIMHMPGADQVLLMGGLFFTFGFLPLLFLNFYKKSMINAL